MTRRAKALAAGADLAVEATAAEVAAALRSGGIRAILLKGPSLAHWLYDSNSSRVAVDVDFLVATADRSKAEAVLAELGYTPFPSNVAGEDISHAQHWSRGLDALSVDLHLSLPGLGVSNAAAWNVLARDTDRLLVRGVPVEVLAPPARAMHVALHAAQHGVGFAGPMADLERGIAQLPIELWKEAAGLARRLRAEPMFAAGLGLLPAGAAVLEELDFPTRKTIEAALRTTSPPDLVLGLHRLTTIPGLRGKVAFVHRKVVPPPAWMRSWIPLARRGNVGLAASYAWRPVWLILRVPPALKAWRRARKESNASA